MNVLGHEQNDKTRFTLLFMRSFNRF